VSLGVPMIRALNGLLRLARKDFLGDTLFGATLLCNPHDLIQTTILHFGVWEPEISSVISGILEPGDIFVDIGANTGYDTLLGSKLVGPEGGVVSIEAAPDTFRRLKENVARNGCQNVRTENLAASDKRGRLSMFSVSSTNLGAATTIPRIGNVRIAEVDAFPLDEILTQQELIRAKLIKIDVEGAEYGILQTIIDKLSIYPRDMQLIVEMSADQPNATRVFEAMLSAGFSAYSLENVYSYSWYLKWGAPSPPVVLTRLPDEQTDVLFRRDKASRK
jgi:FkbM family methyltransferase